MIEVVSVKFKNRGKCYFFAPNGHSPKAGEKVIVETAKGLEIADCSQGCHMVEDTAVVQPLRPVVRIATADDLRVAEINKKREREAFEICQKKIEEHGLDMKLVDVECNFDGNKTMFFFTSDGRVDFRELVKDLAGIFRNRIELRQIGVRDEAKMLGGIGICGRPYCCHQFLDEFQPVSTKMAKVQSLSLNPTKISGSCGRLMCCLRYEQEAYEELIKKVPKQGAFVETTEGYGTAAQVNLLRQTVKVKLDGSGDNELRAFRACEVAAVPGGRPKDGETPPSVLKYIPEPEEEETIETSWRAADEWALPTDEPEAPAAVEKKKPNRRRHRSHKGGNSAHKTEAQPKPQAQQQPKPQQPKNAQGGNKNTGSKPQHNNNNNNNSKPKPQAQQPKGEQGAQEKSAASKKRRYYNHRGHKPKTGGKPNSGKTE